MSKLMKSAFSKRTTDAENISKVDPTTLQRYVDLVLPRLAQILFDKPRESLTDYHLDKAYQYHDKWISEGFDVRRASVIYLLTYTHYLYKTEKSKSCEFVIENYELFSWVLKFIEHPLRLQDDSQKPFPYYVVAAANRYTTPDGERDFMLVGARHWSHAMHLQFDSIRDALKVIYAPDEYTQIRNSEEQGFINQCDEFMTRYQAYVVARVAGQLNTRRPKSGSAGEPILWSEDLY